MNELSAFEQSFEQSEKPFPKNFFQLHLLQKIDFQPYYSSIQARDKAMQTFTQNTTKRSINLYGIFQSYQIVFFRVITAAAICWFCLMNSILASDAITHSVTSFITTVF